MLESDGSGSDASKELFIDICNRIDTTPSCSGSDCSGRYEAFNQHFVVSEIGPETKSDYEAQKKITEAFMDVMLELIQKGLSGEQP